MSGLFAITVQEARGFVATSAELDRLAVVIGCSSLGSGLSPFFLSGSSAIAALGYGDAVDTLSQIIEQVQPDGGQKYPAAMYTTPGTTTGSYGAINVTGVTGTSVVTNDASVHPYGTYEARLRVTLGGTIATGPISFVWSLDGGRAESVVTALGTAITYTIPNSNVKFNFAAGSLVTGDIISVRTLAPAPTATDIDAAFVAIAASTVDCGIVVCEFPCTAALAAHVKTGLAALRAVGKRVTALLRAPIRNFEGAQSEATWVTAEIADYAAFQDSNECVSAAYGFITDAMTSRTYLRSDLAQWAADVVRVPRGRLPDVPFDRAESNFLLVDANGTTVGHDEGPRGAVTGLSDDTLGNRFRSVMRLPDAARRESVFTTVPWVMYAPDERIRNLPTRRLANALERTAVSAGTSALGENLFFTSDPDGSNKRLTPASLRAIQGVIWAAEKEEFTTAEIQNLQDGDLNTGLVQVNPAITTTGFNLVNVSVTLAPRIGGYLLTLSITLALQG